ncbi:GNAT family N-acetyltransferase [Paracidovorax cattleyae]|uniref:GNAT family N-acetyltransferase n=1 Tax=Paracidovorax cattleyae TaxID=80868 RepID=UPI001CEFABFE|nr:GNAT family N-acetyltransferase [Paracidovorax cattleyae]
MRIRHATLQDAAHLLAIEQSAAGLFRGAAGLEGLADGPGMAQPEHERLILQGAVWVAEAAPGQLVGFLDAEAFGQELHLWELSVHADWQRMGIGTRLIQAAQAHAAAQGLVALTLTTFADLPWSAPAYARLGFRPISPPGPRLQWVMDVEATHGLPMGRRVAMRMGVDRPLI